MSKKRIKPLVKYGAYVLLLIVLAFFGIYDFCLSLDNKQTRVIEYAENNKIDYKVYLKENNFFETPYLGAGVTYISSLIDYIDINFSYKASYDKILNGNYTYNIVATIVANKANQESEKYWSKDYNLVTDKTIQFEEQSGFLINENIQIDYATYNDLLTSFKKEYGLAVDGVLKVSLNVVSTATNEELPVADVNSVVALEIPLTQSSVDIAIDTMNQNKTEEFKDEVILHDKKYLNYKILSGVYLLLILVTVYGLILNIKEDRKKRTRYEKDLKNILNTYDSIIVNVKSLKKLSDYHVIRVQSFDELIDAHSEVRMPINFVEVDKGFKSVFALINNDIAWVYELVSD